ncbi:SDR family NAD(P)-dependent oxidoreductase [Agarilytica rhodophyticola]|uniref:SDR family NAD(P)-dependent oxidoreductase n=1 Tax=Agarilytica rhodophyticola TaxID=1737490 RepID=UPI001319FFB2|nr:SDR family NAD(P)-dependent oxidoreductase [Agarilytica rhodophyticola]
MSNKTIWITGASSGIGFDLAKLLAKHRNYLYISARSEDKLLALKAQFPDNIFVLPIDVGDSASLAKAEEVLHQQTDQLDMLISCVGTCEYDDVPALQAEQYERLTRVNYLGTVETVRIALPLLRKSASHPHIVAISSLAALVPFPRAAAYGASKAALEYFLQSLKVDIASDNISISIVRPGFVDTPLTQQNDFDMPFLMPSDLAAKHIVKAITKRKMFIDFPKQMSIPLKIMRFLPSFFWMKICAPRFRKPEVL